MKVAYMSFMNVIDLADEILKEAIENNISDIHFEPFEKIVRLRFRKDGKLYVCREMNKQEAVNLSIRLKIMAGMDIANTRKPQDGKLKYKYKDRQIDLRFSVLPTIFGEKIVIRVLDQATGLLSLENLMIPEEASSRLISELSRNNGLILVVGPTGSGKTTTLYALLQKLNSCQKNIVTIEDPVEYQLEGINQLQVNKTLTFAQGLRAVLRQDPDIILVGEIRDLETAEICLRAALTGHLVLGTLHTKDSVEAVIRLLDMGIPSFRISSALRGVLAQRLLPKVSEQGGRQAIFEYLNVSRKIQEAINNNVGYNHLREKALLDGLVTMQESAVKLQEQGIIGKESLLEFKEEL